MKPDSMLLPEIPETATEEYLEKLTEKILLQLEKASNRNVRLRLTALLQEVQRRKKKLLEETAEPPGEISQKNEQDAFKMFDTANLSTNEQQQIKERLKHILEDIKKQRPESQQFSLDLSVSNAVYAETSPQDLLSTVELTEYEHHIVKERMKEMLTEVQEQRQDRLLEEYIPEEDDDDVILLEEEVEPGEELSQEAVYLEGEIFQEGEIESEDVILLEEEVFPEEEEYVEDEYIFPEDSEGKAHIDEQDEEIEEVFTFENVCNKVKTGEPLTLFKKLVLTEREQAMFVAFEGYIKQTKGLKRQQVFDIQHLTSRSIRELDQLFKTYHLQGYLNVELHNIYNRLLNLRSRISILLS